MDSFLLATKLRIPPPPQHGVERGRLGDALDRGLPHYKLVLVSAPAGYGKTTLLSQWARSSEFPVAWLSLDEADNDLDRFLRYLLAAWEVVQPGVAESQLSLLLGGISPDSAAALPAFINEGSEASHPIVFILDDYHLIDEPAIHEALTFLIDHLPPPLHFVLAGRAEPPLPLARWRARQVLLELRADELQFSPEETAAFLQGGMGLEISRAEVGALQAQLEGWITGLQLAALTLRRRPEGAELPGVSGRHRFIADYLSEDVLARLPDEMRRFLLQTSLLKRLCGPLCDAVTGDEGSQAMLERLERENLFLLPLDDNRHWFRYHRLFADFLQAELNRVHPAEVATLHRRAAHWWADQELPEQAFNHAVAGDDLDLVIELVEKYFPIKFSRGEYKLLGRWIDALPEAWLDAYPLFGLVRASVLAFTGAFEDCVRCVEDVARKLGGAKAEAARPQMARVRAVQCAIACVQNDLTGAEQFADLALLDLPADDVFFYETIMLALGDTYRRHGRWEEAESCYRNALERTRRLDFRFRSVHALGALADLSLRQGHLRQAADYWNDALALIDEGENRGTVALPAVGWVHIRMGELLYEWNRLPEAWSHLSAGLERAELGGDVRAMIAGYLLAGRLALTEGDTGAAADYLERARPLVDSAQFPDWTAHFQRFQLEYWLAEDRLRAAVHWVDRMLADDKLDGRSEDNAADLAVARVLIVKGDTPSLEGALKRLVRLIAAAEADGRTGVLIEALALQALGRRRRGDNPGALTALEGALRLAEPEGYVRLFADLGLPMARLLQDAAARAVRPAYVEMLLGAFVDDMASSVSHVDALPEPLSPREQEVLELLAAGLTNREIGESLVISPQTVKKHAANIYGKLGVGNRTEAVTRARELDLLN